MTGFKILSFREMLQGLPKSLAQVKAREASENLLNEILQIIRFLTVCYYHVMYEFQSESTLYSLPEYQVTPCYLIFRQT